MTEDNSLQAYAQLLEQRKSQTLASLQRQIAFNVSGFYDSVLLRLDTLANPSTSIAEQNKAIERTITKAIDFYQISLLDALKEAFNLKSIFPFLLEKNRPNTQQQNGKRSRSAHPGDDQSIDSNDHYVSDYSGMIECEINTDDEEASADSDNEDDALDQTYTPPSKGPSGSVVNSKRPKRGRPCSSTKRPKQQYSCNQIACGKIFNSLSALSMHRLIHTGDRPYTCEHCGSGFTQKGARDRHLRTHSRQMSHRCTWPGCSYTATNSAGILDHVRGRHFKLPQRKKVQAEKGILDDRDATQFCEKIEAQTEVSSVVPTEPVVDEAESTAAAIEE